MVVVRVAVVLLGRVACKYSYLCSSMQCIFEALLFLLCAIFTIISRTHTLYNMNQAPCVLIRLHCGIWWKNWRQRCWKWKYGCTSFLLTFSFVLCLDHGKKTTSYSVSFSAIVSTWRLCHCTHFNLTFLFMNILDWNECWLF